MRDGRSSLTDKWPQLPTSCDRCNGDPPYGAIVFKSVFWNTDQIKLEPYSIIQLTNNLFCTSEFEEQSWENMIEYLKGSAKSTMSGQSIGYSGPQVSSEWDFWSFKGSIKPPSNLASSWSKQLANGQTAHFAREAVIWNYSLPPSGAVRHYSRSG